MVNHDLFWMKRCLALAMRGDGAVSPNPLVGCVIVKNGRKIAEGFHEVFGGPHAEIHAIRSAVAQKKDLRGATLYVNLEPCSHHGKTPPCADAIVKHGISRVVIGMKDPNPLVSGRGLHILRRNGIRCTVGVLKPEAARMNERFVTAMEKHRPFVALKAAQTADGFIAKADRKARWITNKRSRALVHRLRSTYDAVLVGAMTVISDDPSLTVRSVSGKNPIRIVLDGNFSVPVRRKIFSSEAETIVFVSEFAARRKMEKVNALRRKNVIVVPMKAEGSVLHLSDVLRDLARRNIGSVFVEGGAKTYAAFFNARTVDKLYLFTSPKKYGKGVLPFDEISVSYRRSQCKVVSINKDTMQEFDIDFSKRRA